MKEIQLTQMQIEDATADMYAAVDEAFSISDQEEGVYVPDKIRTPRPDFALFEAGYAEYAEVAGKPEPVSANGRLAIGPKDAAVLENFAGLRGLARTQVITESGERVIVTGPAIVLEDGCSVAVLTAERPSAQINEMQHAFLSAEYVKQKANVQAEHRRSDVTNAGEIGPSLMVASSGGSLSAHSDMHELAAQTRLQTFGTNFSDAGRQDIQVGHETRSPRSTVVAVNRVILYAGSVDQLPRDARLLGVELTDDELAVGMTLAATESRGVRPNVTANLTNIVGA